MIVNTPDGPYGGFSDIALDLTLTYKRLFSRQVVYRWWTKRYVIGFPDAELVTDVGTGDSRELLSVEKVRAWYEQYTPRKGGRPLKVREPAE